MVLVLWSAVNGGMTLRCLSVSHDFDYNIARMNYLRLREEDELRCSYHSMSCFPNFDSWLLKNELAVEPTKEEVLLGSFDPY